jgi:uncharacterized phage infection (PIP) family protein YhgE
MEAGGMVSRVLPVGPAGVAVVLAASLLGACGGEDKSGSETTAAAQSTAAEAVKQIDKTTAGLDRAVQQLRDGDAKAAKETVSETYLQHFEDVEHPLEEVAPELKEGLEEGIADDLRNDIGKTSTDEVVAEVDALKRKLATAKDKLQP